MRATVEEIATVDDLLVVYNVLPTGQQHSRFLRWAEALESGRRRQTRAFLRDSYGYCCLGIVSEISGKGTFKEYMDTVKCFMSPQGWEKYRKSPTKSMDSFGSTIGLIPEVMNWLGLDKGRDIIILKPKNGFGSLKSLTFADLNDDADLNFRQIAHIIRLSVAAGKKLKAEQAKTVF